MSKAAELAKMGEVLTNSQIGRKNIVINGAMQISQRATSSTGLGAADGYFTLDRFRMTHGATSAGRYTMTQSAVTDLSGFPNALKIDCTTVDTSIAAGEALIIQHRVEGFNLQSLKATSTSTRAFTVSFYAKSNASRAINTEIRFGNGTNRQATKTHTIGTSWARYTMTVPAASSTQIDNDNSHEMDLNFWIHAGSTYQGGTVNSSLHGNDATTRAAGIGSIFASTDNTLEITGLQIELGSVATPFEHRSFGEEKQLCKRYYHHIQGTAQTMIAKGLAYDARAGLFNIDLPTSMRAAYSLTHSGVSTLRWVHNANAHVVASSIGLNDSTSLDIAGLYMQHANNVTTVGYACGLSLIDANAYIAFDAEL